MAPGLDAGQAVVADVALGVMPPVMAPSTSSSSPQPLAYVNGKRRMLPPNRATQTLLEYLRELGLTGTKLGCGEGGCGACTVIVSQYDRFRQKVVHRAVNACLAPLYSIEGMHVVTVEGIGNRRDGLHPVQEKLANAHGSQCGFCTPGFVMSMYALLRSLNGRTPSEAEIEECLAGNLCRCTGYRPILDAFKTFAKTDASAYTEDAHAANGVHNDASHVHDGGTNICPSTGKPCDCAKPTSSGIAEAAADKEAKKVGVSEPIFPPELMSRKLMSLALIGNDASWFRPSSLEELLALKAEHPTAKIVVGNSEVGIEQRFKNIKYPLLLSASQVPEMNDIALSDEGVTFGASVSLSAVMEACKELVANRPAHETSTFAAVIEQLRWFAGSQIRNVACLGGNIVTASPISDLNPIWMASGAMFNMMSRGASAPRSAPAKEFFIGYRKVDMRPEEVLVSVFVPYTRKYEYVKEFKQAHRREDDIAIVNAGMRVAFDVSRDTPCVSTVSLAFGGMAPRSVSAPRTEALLMGRPWNEDTLQEALKTLAEDLPLAQNAPGGMIEFRRSLAASFLFKFFVHTTYKLEQDVPDFRHSLPDTYKSAPVAYERPTSSGLQYYDHSQNGEPVGAPLMHMTAELQVTGEAQYVDDVAAPAGCLHAALVVSTRPHAQLLHIDASAAELCPGFEGFFCAKDVPGSNNFGHVKKDELCFAEDKVTCVGQVIGVVVADTHENAKAAARAVAISYEDLPAILSIDDAIAAGSLHEWPERELRCGDVDTAFDSAKSNGDYIVLEGECRIGGQEHFYLEPNATLVLPGEHDEMVILSSTQNPDSQQKLAAEVLGVPNHKVVAKTKRLGGGFGGKESRSQFIGCAVVVAAAVLRRPVRVALDRDVDMSITGQRHPFMGKYKVCATHEGKLVALDATLYSNAGNTYDLSWGVMERAMFHIDNSYRLPNARVAGKVCKTNMPSNTAFRGFGGPQGMMVMEMLLDHVATAVGKTKTEVQELNLYSSSSDVTHYGQTLTLCQAPACWQLLRSTCELERRLETAEEFNRMHRYRKRGIALVPTKFGIAFTVKFLNQAGALVHVYTDGTVLVAHGGVEMGQGLHTKMAQVAAGALNIPVSSVFIQETSTDKVPNASPTAASASSDLYGGAVLDACLQLAERLRPFREANPEAAFAEIAHKAYMERVDLCAHGFHKTPDIHFDWTNKTGMPFSYFTYGAACSEVEIDTLTGDLQILRSDVVMDLGKSLNPAIDVGQVEGAFVQGVGWCAIEELVWGDREHPWVRPGELFTRGPGTYKIPSANDIPVDFRVHLLKNSENPRAVHSSKAVGEPPLFLAASVFFAIKEAVKSARKDNGIAGHFVLDSPATPERIRLACADTLTGLYAPHDIRPKISC